jgi:hypothetical protein
MVTVVSARSSSALIPKDSNAADHASLSQVEAPGDEDNTVMCLQQAELLLEILIRVLRD